MLLFRYFLLFSLLLLTHWSWAQTAFSANWSFEGNANGSSSNGLVTASVATPVGVNYFGANPFTTGYAGLGANVQNWSTTVCNNTEYIQITVQPGNGAKITLTALSFAFARTPQGPQQISVRSSANGFSADLYAQTVTETYQIASVSLSGAGFIDQAGPVTFRIYGCNPTNGGGLLKLDEININGSVLPVELLYFNAQLINDRVELAWATVWERDAERFVIERSRDLLEFGILGSVSAKGTTDQTQRYAFTDLFPDGGTTYYRLKQVDYNGATAYSKPVAVIVDDHTPTLVILGNPADGKAIQVASRNLNGAVFSVFTVAGQQIPLQSQPNPDGSLTLYPAHLLPPGSYWLRAQGSLPVVKRLIIR